MSETPPRRWDAVSFDAGGTLIEPWPSVGHVYAAVAAKQGCGDFEPELINRRFLEAWGRRRRSFDHTKTAWEAVVRETFADLVESGAVPDLFEALYTRFASGDAWRMLPDVELCLEALRSQGRRLAVISNFDERLFPLLADVGLAGYFEIVIASGPLALHKPESPIFELAARRLGLPPSRILHVGDSIADDFDGARRSGFSSVLLHRHGFAPTPDCIASMTGLPSWIEARESAAGD